MAGGKFDKLAGKVRPGTYINFESTRKDTVGISERGIVLIPLIGHTYGPEKEFITITNAAPDGAFAKLGYSIYDDDAQMLLIREAFKLAAKVIVYVPKVGLKAKGTGGGVVGTAAYGGSRGNSLKYTITANPVSGFDVSVYLGESLAISYEAVLTTAELVAKKCEYITFSADAANPMSAVAGVSLAGGTDVVATNSDITAFLDAMESVKFNTLAFPSIESTLQTACKTKIKYLRENVGKGVKAAIPDFTANYEGIINVTNSVALDGKELTHAQACAWVAGADAAARNTQSNTYLSYEGATAIVDAKTHEEAVAAIQNGEFFFSYSEAGAVVVEYDINSLTTFSGGKDKTYSKNRVLRVFDTFGESVQLNFPPNKYDNSPDGWDIMEGIGHTILKQFYEAGAIKNVDYDTDFTVDRGKSTGDETYFNVAIEPVDSAEKLYFTVSTR
ncbi:MAG: phage tail sheath subtilisin-like domain-containing protein [Oscillospiraceae bacterium]